MKTALQKIKQALAGRADSVGKNKAGNVVVRRGYFYRNGMDADTFATQILNALGNAQVVAHIVNKGDVWKPFRGGASVAQQSHFFVELAV